MQVKKQRLELDMDNGLVPNWERTASRLWLSPYLFKLYAEYIMQNARLEEAETRIKIAGININNLKYADDTIFMGESKEELKSLLMKVKEESGKRRLKTHH